jgi:hypothetical protein
MGMGMGGGGGQTEVDEYPLDMSVEIYGIIYMYNPPDPVKLGVEQVTEDTIVDGETLGGEKVAPTPSSDQQPAAPTAPQTPAAPDAQDPAPPVATTSPTSPPAILPVLQP